MEKDKGTTNSVIGKVSEYISRGGEAKLPAEVIEKAKHHILDTLAAMISGQKLKPGHLARKYVRSQAGVKEAQVIGSRMVVPAINAALANGMMGHADETDDVHLKSVGSHVKSVCHPGCAAVPAALAIAEQKGADGMRFLKGVVVGYDIGCRIFQAIGIDFHVLQKSHFSTHGIGANFSAAAAAAAVSGLKGDLIRYVLSYVANQTSGQHYWMRDAEHVEKAFVFGGMPARNGVTATILVQSGFTGVWDAFSGDHNFFEPFNSYSKPALLAEGLGAHYEIMHTTIKKLPIGGPLISPLDGLFYN